MSKKKTKDVPPKVFDTRVYPGDEAGFDVILRVHGGIMRSGNFPTLESAIEAARATPGRKDEQPVYVYSRSFAALFADAVAPAVEALLPKTGEQSSQPS